MRPPVSPEFRAKLANVVRQPEPFAQYLWRVSHSQMAREWSADIPPPEQEWPHAIPPPGPWPASPSEMASILPDVIRFRYQSRELQHRNLPQYAAFFRDDGPDGEELPILVEVPNLRKVETSYSSLLNTLEKSNFRFEKVEPPSAEEIFVDRLAEFLSVRPSAASQSNRTIVHSNRRGDTVIYAYGYFTSTGTAFGVSTPASKSLASGRYSFGIIESGKERWENIVWTCPNIVQLNLP